MHWVTKRSRYLIAVAEGPDVGVLGEVAQDKGVTRRPGQTPGEASAFPSRVRGGMRRVDVREGDGWKMIRNN